MGVEGWVAIGGLIVTGATTLIRLGALGERMRRQEQSIDNFGGRIAALEQTQAATKAVEREREVSRAYRVPENP